MAHKHNKKSNFLPSPYPVVTSYENAFVKKFNENIAGAVADVLKYVARATASAIKNQKVEKSEEVEKAHQVGDIHQNGKWVWTEYAPGKFDWRSKGGSKKKINAWDMVSAIDKCKTVSECLRYLHQHDVISVKSHLNGVSLQTAKRVCSVLYNIHSMYGLDTIEIISASNLNGATADASAGRRVRLNLKMFSDFDDKRYYKTINLDYVSNLKISLKRLENLEDSLKKNGTYDPVKGKQLSNKIQLIKDKLDKFPCWTLGEMGHVCEDIVIHELGHILNSQCTGACSVISKWKSSKLRDSEYIKMSEELNQECYDIFKRYCKEKKCISEYSTTKRAEFFTECFVDYVHGGVNLPKYVKVYFDKYFKSTKPKNLL